MDKLHVRINKLCAIFVFLFTLSVFVITAAPTVAFWDSGESVAGGHSLGITHPSGSPLFVMMLRVSSMMLSFVDDAGYRMNIVSAFFGAFTALLIYLSAVRIIIALCGGPNGFWKKFSTYTGGLMASFFAVFGKTFWFSATEASKISLYMFAVSLCLWLALVWAQSKNEHRDRLLVLLTFICFVCIGLQIYLVIALAPVFLFVILTDRSKVKNWRFAALLLIFAATGFSAHLYLPVRSSTEPMINVNHPATYQSLKDYLLQKPYGDENRFTAMPWRRGSFSNQFGIEGHIGYGGYHITQFFRLSVFDSQKSLFTLGITVGLIKFLIYLIPTALMFYGWYYAYKKKRTYALFLISFFLLASVFMVLYMNFADGTRSEKIDFQYWMYTGKPGELPLAEREVRIRDYFFTGAYMHLGMWVGIGAAIIMSSLFASRRKFFRNTAAPLAACLFVYLAFLPLTQNWKICSRRGDFLPYDYAYNMLMSCEKDAVLFTSGDNDTFPLWALQEAYGIRKDVRVVNLALLNEGWYIKQLQKLEPKAPISYTENEIDNELKSELNPYEDILLLKVGDAQIAIPSRLQFPILKVQDRVVINILRTNSWARPLYFASSVPEEQKVGLGPYLQQEGFVERIMPYELTPVQKVNIDKTVYLIDSVFLFRGRSFRRDLFDETSLKIVYNYVNTYIQLALTLKEKIEVQKQELARMQKQGHGENEIAALRALLETNKKTAHSKMSQCVGFTPYDWRPRYIRHEVLMAADMEEQAETYARQAIEIDPREHRHHQMLAQALEKQNRNVEAARTLRRLIGSNVDQQLVYSSIAENFEKAGMIDSALHIMRQYALIRPTDPLGQSLIEYYIHMEQKADGEE
jgi:tetratricopeptide (TPR) repeat protein